MEVSEETHKQLAVQLNGIVWELLGQDSLSDDDPWRLIHTAHACLYHWTHAGTMVNIQRGEWLISHVYAVLGLGEASLRHAQRCLHLTNAQPEMMRDFDKAYAYEGIARAHAVSGHREAAAIFKSVATDLGRAIADDEDRRIFEGDFAAGNWHGVS